LRKDFPYVMIVRQLFPSLIGRAIACFVAKKNSAPPTQFPTGLVASFKTGLESLGTLKRKSPKKWKKKRIYFFFYFTFVIIIFIIFFYGCLPMRNVCSLHNNSIRWRLLRRRNRDSCQPPGLMIYHHMKLSIYTYIYIHS
jgi:hypothetical protein